MRTASMKSVNSFWQRSLVILQLTRPIFLAGGILLYSVGSAIAWKSGYPFDWKAFLYGLFTVSTVQLSAQYCNEYYDRDVDSLSPNQRTWFSGGSGILSGGMVQPTFALRASLFFAGCALLLLLWIFLTRPFAAVIGVVALIGSWAYSARPIALVGTGFGEMESSIIVTLLVPATGILMQTRTVLLFNDLLLCLPLFFIHAAMIVALELPDYRVDQLAGKRTLAVRFGYRYAVALHNLFLFVAFLLLAWLTFFQQWKLHLAWIVFPLAVFQMIAASKTTHAQPKRFHWLTFRAVALVAFSSLLILISILVF